MAEPVGPPPADPRCGTQKGYQAHRNTGTPPCEPCAQAAHDYGQGYWLARREAMKRLIQAHRPEFLAMVREERQKVSAGDAR